MCLITNHFVDILEKLDAKARMLLYGIRNKTEQNRIGHICLYDSVNDKQKDFSAHLKSSWI